jgi:hypothetical protein
MKSQRKKVTPKVTPKEKPIKLEMFFNGLEFSTKTDDLKKAILKLKPEILYTEVYIKISKGEYVFERRFNLKQGKNLFINEDFLNVFVNNLLIL